MSDNGHKDTDEQICPLCNADMELCTCDEGDTATIHDLLRYACLRGVPFSPRLVPADAPLQKTMDYGWLRRIDKPNNRCAYVITEAGREAFDALDRIVYRTWCPR